MNTQMGSALPTEKLDRTNFAIWEYKMHQYLVGQGYWSYIEPAHESQPNPTHTDYPAWEQAASHVLYCLSSCVHDHMLGYIREAKTLKQAWENLKKIFAANTAARKLQLRQKLNDIQQRDMSIGNYTLKIKELCDALGSINVIIDDDEMVQICLGGLAPRFGAIRLAVLVCCIVWHHAYMTICLDTLERQKRRSRRGKTSRKSLQPIWRLPSSY